MLLALPFGIAIGLAVGMLGGGGSVLAVPVLVYVLGEDVQSATTASLVVVTIAALAGGLGQARGGRVCWRHALAFTLAAVPGLLAGTAAAEAVSGDAVLAGFAVVMLAAAWATWRKARAEPRGEQTGDTTCPPLRPARDAAAGVLIGSLTGFFGVGGGFVIVPTLAIWLGLDIRAAIGTSLVVISATSLVGVVVHLVAGRTLDVGVTASLTAACVVGALAGSALGSRVPQATLGRGFALLVMAVAVYLLIASAFLGGPPGG